MSKLLNCDTCEKLVVDTSMKTIHTPNKGDMKVCKSCYDNHNEVIKAEMLKQDPPISTDNQLPSVSVTIQSPSGGQVSIEPVKTTPKTDPAVQAYISTYGQVPNPESVPRTLVAVSSDISEPVEKGKRLTQEQLFAEYLRDEQVKISEIFDSSKEGFNLGKAYKKLEDRIELMQSIVFQSKVRASELTKKQRELDALSGKNRWDKERRGENKSNNSDPRTNPLMSKAQKDKKAELSKVEKQVKGMMDIGTEPDDIITMMTATGKFKGIEVREAIEKFRKG